MARLNAEERELLKSVERGEWRTVASKSSLKRYARAARNTLKKDCRVNIRLARADFEGLRTKAVEEGLPYQTLIASVLHKYVTGSLTRRR